jgi:hypothetical protein
MAVTQVDQKWYLDIFRSAMWSICKGVLYLLDGFFDIIDGIWRYRFFDNEYVNKIFGGAVIVACSWLVLKVVLELIMNYIVKNEGKGSPLTIYRGIVLAIVMMFLVTPLFQFGHNVSTALTDAVIEVSGMGSGDQETTISNALVRSMVYKDEMYDDDVDYLVSNWKNVDINATEGGVIGIGDVYLYSLNFFMLIVLSVVTIFLLFFVAIQMAKRVMEIALFKIIAPFCCTSLTTGQSKAFETWTKSTMGLFLITVVQFICIGLLLNMFGSAIQDNGTLTGIFLIVGALLFIISTPTIISSLLGQQSGMMTAFGDMQSLMALGQGVNAGINVAKGGLASGVSVIPKTAGHLSGVKDQFNNFKAGGSSTMGALGKTALSEASRPFVTSYQKALASMSKNYNDSKAKGTNPFGLDTSNPFKNPHSIQFNPIRNQYQNQNNNMDGGMT